MASDNIRKAVGAIVTKNNSYLLVHKVKMMNTKDGPETINSRWDFPKGGVKNSDNSLQSAILRELLEETGSSNFKVIKEFDEKIRFVFPKKIQEKLGFKSQKVVMFLIEFKGDEKELMPQDEEIDELKFMSKEEVENKIIFHDSLNFFRRNV